MIICISHNQHCIALCFAPELNDYETKHLNITLLRHIIDIIVM